MRWRHASALLLAALLLGPAAAAPSPDAATAHADYLRGLAYRNGSHGLPVDAARAAAALTAAAEGGVPEAMFILSHMLAEGEGTTRDPAAARRWLEAAAQAEYPEALQEMAMRAMSERDPASAAELLREAAHAMQHRAHESQRQ
ncbi:SEL1-like repeat protein [Herbaspirillum sp. SJZ107]|uniref:SEL1-like repeat protein n=1 Tax=Herbaspirillum sp. SJZ107 TaxID=2572881 RepID=UPI001150C0E6|nr:SEL1-like repeat protein [Herbaspirillum sp. SJZ107]TQK11251.1 Sel1 repeat-containing protein [Herbaspirillum sp. SJZ107]